MKARLESNEMNLCVASYVHRCIRRDLNTNSYHENLILVEFRVHGGGGRGIMVPGTE